MILIKNGKQNLDNVMYNIISNFFILWLKVLWQPVFK